MEIIVNNKLVFFICDKESINNYIESDYLLLKRYVEITDSDLVDIIPKRMTSEGWLYKDYVDVYRDKFMNYIYKSPLNSLQSIIEDLYKIDVTNKYIIITNNNISSVHLGNGLVIYDRTVYNKLTSDYMTIAHIDPSRAILYTNKDKYKLDALTKCLIEHIAKTDNRNISVTQNVKVFK